MYKIGFIATHGTGKTTLAWDIAAQLNKSALDPSVRVIDELSTLARERGIPIDKTTTLEAQAWILTRQVSAELGAAIYNYDVAICDRTVFDNYCYMKRKVGDNQHYLQFALGHAQQHPYNKLYYLPITEKLAPKKRDADPTFQAEIDSIIKKFLADYNITYTSLPLVPPKERNEWVNIVVNRTLNDLKNMK